MSVAELDIAETYTWYCQSSNQLAEAFLEDFDTVCRNIRQFPKRHPELSPGVRVAQFPNYPYKAVYDLSPNSISVLAVYHQSRDPRDWMKRV